MARPLGAVSDAFAVYHIRTRIIAKGVMKKGKPAAWVRFTPELFKQIREEAVARGCSFSAIVNELCNASIDGIE
jgi:hypothetical protein